MCEPSWQYPNDGSAGCLANIGRRSASHLVHNHPSCDPAPSKADIEMTRQVRDAAKAVDIALHDHLVIGQGRHASFRALGLL